MLKSGSDYLESIRDGRRIYVADELVTDATTHPAFAEIVKTYAALYDLKRAKKNEELLTYEEDGERHSIYFSKPRTQEDLALRSRAHKFISDWSYGLLGRSPDASASNITGMTMQPDILARAEGGFAENLTAIWKHLRDTDSFLTYAVVPPPAARNPDFYEGEGLPMPTLRVTAENDNGVTINGMKCLATGAAIANEVIVGNILPLAPERKAESITCVIPLDLSGISLWARKPIADASQNEFDAPLSYRYDESDCVLVFKDVKVPWEKILVHNNAALSRDIFVKTASHVLSNHQSNCRFHSKLKFLLGLASQITNATGARSVPAVRELLGRLAAMEAGFGALLDAQIYAYEDLGNGYVLFNRRYMYAGLNWSMENHSWLLDTIRELMGGGVFQFPASIDVMKNEEISETFEHYWRTEQHSAKERMKLFKLAWDAVGTEHASRLQSYEKFFVGPPFSYRNYNYVNAPWNEFEQIIDDLMDQYDTV